VTDVLDQNEVDKLLQPYTDEEMVDILVQPACDGYIHWEQCGAISMVTCPKCLKEKEEDALSAMKRCRADLKEVRDRMKELKKGRK